ncbi:hypothetical protein [Bacillus cereus]|uniref:Uncharacterized protein n=1 Tax=Bacillus cereus HuA3-9 TaxID=1053205 RepID=R8CIF2_BACCE|nr:hypothetical protein [Bacillus cereus]EOO11315.1 hypothetical protein IGA_05578 [Bacillus cereus HuA3-9]
MRVLEPQTQQEEQFPRVELGDMLVTNKDTYVCMEISGLFRFHSMSGRNAYNGTFQSLGRLTQSVKVNVLRGAQKLYRASEYDMQLVPRKKVVETMNDADDLW